MKHTFSLQTEPTTINSTDSQLKNVKVFIIHQGNSVYVRVPLQSKTLKQLIIEAAHLFNREHSVILSRNLDDYVIYMAKKTGKKCEDYPSLEQNQDITLTNIKNYYIEVKSLKVIPKKIDTNIIHSKKKQTKIRQMGSCFCF